jgi:hypothetical protein
MGRLSCDPGKVNNLQEKEMTKETKNREDKRSMKLQRNLHNNN